MYIARDMGWMRSIPGGCGPPGIRRKYPMSSSLGGSSQGLLHLSSSPRLQSMPYGSITIADLAPTAAAGFQSMF